MNSKLLRHNNLSALQNLCLVVKKMYICFGRPFLLVEL